MNRRALREAHDYCARILSLEPGHADAHFLMGMIAFSQNQIGKALALIDRALARVPNNTEYLSRRAQCLSMMKRTQEAAESVDRALAEDPQDAATLDTIGVVLSRVGRHEQAIEVLGRAAAAAPERADIHFNRAAAQLFKGDFAGAEQSYEAAIATQPDFYRAHWALSDLVKATPTHNHLDRLNALLNAKQLAPDNALYLCHAIAKEHEDLGDDKTAFDFLSRGKRAKRAASNYSINSDRLLFSAVERTFTAQRFKDVSAGSQNEEPIFIVGMPRSGTTLVERIVTSHSDVYSAGELQDFGLAVKKMSGSRTNLLLDADTLEHAGNINFVELGDRYVASTRPATGHTARFVDKMPMNFFYIGLIALALPKAKIICLRRNPMDTCLANFRQLFRLNHTYYNYSFDLLDTADYFVMFHRLMQHWHDVLPGRVLDVAYEDVVTSQEATSRSIIEFLGLDWQDACLKFHDNDAAVATASAVQVREPIYTGSMNRWKRYGDRLAPLQARLEAAGIQIDS